MSEFTNGDVYEEVPEKDVNVESIKCPNCGNNLKFNPKTQKLFCEYCDTEVEFDQNFNYEEKDLFTALNSTVEQWTETRVFLCEKNKRLQNNMQCFIISLCLFIINC